jgi:hypothetical protein
MVEQKKGIVIIALSIIYLIILILFYGASASSLDLVFLGLSPVFIHLIILSLRVWYGGELLYMWILPFVLSLIFFIIYISGVVEPFASMDGHSLVIWQVLICMILNLVVILLLGTMNSGLKQALSHRGSFVHNGQNTHSVSASQSAQLTAHQQYLQQQLLEQQRHIQALREQVMQTQTFREQANEYLQQNSEFKKHIRQLEDELRLTKQKLHISRQNVDVTLREIEAKAKALNFVVGRVYSDKNGGSAELREKLHISRDLYNAFSRITSDYTQNDAKELLEILTVIKNKLALYELPEKAVFKIGEGGERLLRDIDGNTAILEVLAHNDNDPVVEYYTGAKEICEKVISFLKEK